VTSACWRAADQPTPLGYKTLDLDLSLGSPQPGLSLPFNIGQPHPRPDSPIPLCLGADLHVRATSPHVFPASTIDFPAPRHRFTSFCEEVFELVVHEVDAAGAPSSGIRPAIVFLMNARGNDHTLGIRILSLWLRSKGIETRDFHPAPTPETLFRLATQTRPQAILISLALD
jgi:hypothetical protein